MMNTMFTIRTPWFSQMRTQSRYTIVALILSVLLQQRLPAATPGQAYHRTPVCADGNCAPNRATTGYHATRWRPWPEGEPSQNMPVSPVGIDLKKNETPARDKELELPVRPAAPDENAATEPSPNDKPSGGIVLPPELRDVTPKKPVELPLPDNSNLQRGPMFPGVKSTPGNEPLLLGKKPQPLRSLSPAIPSNNIPADDPPPVLKIRAEGNSQSGLMPEMVPWNDEDKNPIVRQAARISGNQVQNTISLAETALPDATEAKPLTIRVQPESSPSRLTQTSAFAAAPSESLPSSKPSLELATQATEWRSPNANAPAILPHVEAQPLPVPMKVETSSPGNAVASPLRGVSQGNPLRP